ncbi:MAG: tRNA guanosine(34) transglycosylase Tgt [Patescibacteria group bacterium]|jgi:queuine tRNA-ribosyltransferase
MSFKLLKETEAGIRQGKLKTAHGQIKTPLYLPDATRGFLKLLTTKEIKTTGTEALVVNTFHLYLQPGLEVIKRAGGIHRFMNWPGVLISDSGGFQIFSLIHSQAQLGEVSDQGAIFKSPLDGSRHEISPEKSIQIQFDLGVDAMICLDDCPANDFSEADLKRSVDRTIAWAKRSKLEYERQIVARGLTGLQRPLLFAVIQGGENLVLRKYCATELVKLGFAGYGFGGSPIDTTGKFMSKMLKETAKLIPQESLRFALGIGTLADIKRSAKLGWDLFDCVIPTREGRHGRLFLPSQQRLKTINISNTRFKKNFQAINPLSQLPELRNNHLAFLHHLFKLQEPLGQRLASLNNLEAYQKLITDLRQTK